MPSVVWCRKGHTKVLKLSVGLRTQSVECSKLGKTRIIADAVTGWLEMPHFLNRMFHRHSSRNLYHVLLIILFIYYLSLKGAIHGKRQPHKTRRMEDAVRHLLLHHVIYQSVLDVLHCRIIRKIADNLERKRNCSSHSAACDDVSVHNHGVLTR